MALVKLNLVSKIINIHMSNPIEKIIHFLFFPICSFLLINVIPVINRNGIIKYFISKISSLEMMHIPKNKLQALHKPIFIPLRITVCLVNKLYIKQRMIIIIVINNNG